MWDSDSDESYLVSIPLKQGVKRNRNGGYYEPGKQYDLCKKVRVAELYLSRSMDEGGGRPNISKLATDCHVGRAFVTKIEGELYAEGRVIPPDEIKLNMVNNRQLGAGAISLDPEDCFVLYQLYRKHPTRSLKSYVRELYYYTGTIVSESTVSRFFNHGFPIKGCLCKANLVPYDKFRPANIEKAVQYLRYLVQFDPRRVKYADEKSIKGRHIHNKKARRDVLTGIVPATMTDPDLTNRYSLIGICSISSRVTPVKFRITKATVTAELFALEIEDAIVKGFLRAGDVLVMDNAANHTGKENGVLDEWLWEEHQITVLLLPARTPEWNPIELLWNCMDQRLKTVDWSQLRGSDKAAHAAALVLTKITHREVESLYEKSGVFDLHGHPQLLDK